MKKALIILTLLSLNTFGINFNDIKEKANKIHIYKEYEDLKSKNEKLELISKMDTYNRYNLALGYNLNGIMKNDMNNILSFNLGVGDLGYSLTYNVDKKTTLNNISFNKNLNYSFINHNKHIKAINELNRLKKENEINEKNLKIYLKYLDIYYLQENLRIETEIFNTNKMFLEKKEKEYKLGALSEYDFTALQLDYETNKLDIEETKLLLENEKLNLKNMGIDYNLDEEFEKISESELVAYKKSNSLEIAKLTKEIQENEYDEYLLTSLIPTINVNANYTFETKAYGVGLTLSYTGEFIDTKRDEMLDIKNKAKEDYEKAILEIEQQKNENKNTKKLTEISKKKNDIKSLKLSKEYIANSKKYDLGLIDTLNYLYFISNYKVEINSLLNKEKDYYKQLILDYVYGE